MSGTSSVPPLVFTATGPVAPDESAILAGVQADIDAAFGGGLNPGLSTPQGQIAQSDTAIIGDKNDQMLAVVAGVDPATSSGRFQDGIGRIYFLTRNPALPTTVTATVGGLTGVKIPVGARAQATDGNIYLCTQAGTIGVSGTVSLTFACMVTGPIACPAGSLNSIYQSIFGWETITNPSDGVVGNVVESRAAFEARREATVEGNSFGSIGAITGAVAKVPGVLDFYGYDNGTNASVNVGGQTIGANSIYICVAGGASQDIAQAILSKKGPGASYTGATSVTALDSNPLYSAPIPYTVKYQIPDDLPILFAVSIKSSTLGPSNALALIQGAIAAAFFGADGGPRPRIGTELFASRFYAGIAGLGGWAQIISVLVGSPLSPGASFTGTISGTALTVSGVTGTIAVGQTVVGAGVAAGTLIASGSGTSWVVSISQTVPSEAMTGVLASLNDLSVQTNQIPTFDPANVSLTLV